MKFYAITSVLEVNKIVILPENQAIPMQNMLHVILSLIFVFTTSGVVFLQENYNQCIQAFELCSGVTTNANNIDANKTVCPGCEDDFNFCFGSSNTVWFKFTTNDLGGAIQVSFTNLVFENNPSQGNQLQAVMIRALAPCDATTYSAIGNCEAGAVGNFNLIAPNLLPNTEYFIVVNGALNGGATVAAEASFSIAISGESVDRIQPNLYLQIDSLNVCAGYPVAFWADTSNCPENGNYEWFLNDELFAVTTSPYFQTSVLNSGDVVSVTTSCYTNLCPIVLTSERGPFSVLSFPVDAGPNFTIEAGESVILQGVASGISYTWTPSSSLNNATILNPIAVPTETTVYSLSVSDGTCMFSDQATVFVIEALEITNTFTPNGDGSNDTWYIPGLDAYPNCLVEIFDRWGQNVFTTTGYDQKKAWDGTNNGRKMNEGVYFYSITLRDGITNEPLRGTLTLIR